LQIKNNLESRKIDLALFLIIMMAISFIFINLPLARGAFGVFPVGQNVTMGNATKSIQLTFHNVSIDVIDLTFTTSVPSEARPIIDIRGFEPAGETITINQTRGIGTHEWLVFAQVQPIVTGPATSQYFAANNTLQLSGTGDGMVNLFFPVANLVGTTLPLLFLLPIMALLPLGKHKMLIVMAVSFMVILVIATAG